jgi:hypothetical protein
MKKIALFVMSAAVLVSSSAFAQGLTRVEVQQQLVVAEHDGSRLVSNASYPDVARIYSNEVAKNNDANAYGGVAAGTSASSSRIANVGGSSHESCVGPVSFCNLYAGS